MFLTNCKYIAMCFFVASTLSAGVMAQEQELGDFGQLTLEVACGRRKVLPMEPIPITITLGNETGKPIRGHSVIDPGVGYLEIYVAKAGEAFERFQSTNWPAWAMERPRPSVLESGYRRSISTYLYYAHPANLEKEHHGRYLFESPGTYRIKAVLKDIDGENTIESNILAIRVKEPRGKDAAAYKFLKGLRGISDRHVSYGNFLMKTLGRHYHPRKQKVLDKKEEFISKFPRSRYARYARYSLGLTYRLQESERDAQRGIKLLEKAAGYKDFFLAEKALLVLIRDAIKRGETDRAKRYKVMFARRYPNAEEGRDYVEEMYRAPAYWWSFVWPLILIGVVAGVFFFVFVPLLKKKASSGST